MFSSLELRTLRDSVLFLHDGILNLMEYQNFDYTLVRTVRFIISNKPSIFIVFEMQTISMELLEKTKKYKSQQNLSLCGKLV